MSDPPPPGGTGNPRRAGRPVGRVRAPSALGAARPTEGLDRFDRLLEHLLAGRPMPVAPRSTLGDALALVNANLWRVLGLALAVAIAWLAISTASMWYRAQKVDTWTGPDTSVQSGQQLAGCAALNAVAQDLDFPNWVRYGGRVYLITGDTRPIIDSEVGTGNSFGPTPYRDGDLELYVINATPQGLARETILLRSHGQLAGELYQYDATCR
jgi:hypothetical protein